MKNLPVELTAPADDEIEVSIFGPGKGEALAVHLGGGRWMTVDSCVEQRTGVHPTLRYFERIGVDPATQVAFVVGTHAHDDHVAGISRLVEAATNATFITSIAYRGEEFFATMARDAALGRGLRERVRKEYDDVYETLEKRAGSGKPTRIHAVAESMVVARVAEAWSGGPRAVVTALSPSHTAIQNNHRHMREALAQPGDERRLDGFDPNQTSVALWVRVGDLAVLLGADLLIGPTGAGWKAVDTSHFPNVKASLIKVPHHGSSTAHFDRTWTELLTDRPLAVIAPFRTGNVNIPKPDDVVRIRADAGEAYLTAQPKPPTLSKEQRQTRADMSYGFRARDQYGMVGHVQARQVYGTGAWRVGVSAPAFRL